MAEINIFSTPEAERFADRIKNDTKKDIELVQTQLKSEINDVKNQLTNDINSVRHDVELVKKDVELVKNDVKHLQNDVTEIKHTLLRFDQKFEKMTERQNGLDIKIENVRTDLATNNAAMTRWVIAIFVTLVSLGIGFIGLSIKLLT